MLEHVFRLVGSSRAQRDARRLLLSLKPQPDFRACFDAGHCGDLEATLAHLSRMPDLATVLKPWPAGGAGGALFQVKAGHTLELQVVPGSPGRGGEAETASSTALCVTRVGPDLWAWYLDAQQNQGGGFGGASDSLSGQGAGVGV